MDIKIKKPVYRGCPQGSCTAPLLWNAVIHGLLKIALLLGVKVICYADGILYVAYDASLEKSEMWFSLVGEMFKAWAENEKLKFKVQNNSFLFFPKG